MRAAPLKSSAKIFLQHWGLRLLGASSPGRCVSPGLENIAVARAHNQLRTIHADFDVATLSRLRSLLWVVAETVLTTQFFGDLLESHAEVLVLRFIKTRPGDAGEIVQITIAAFIFFAAISDTARIASTTATSAAAAWITAAAAA